MGEDEEMSLPLRLMRALMAWSGGLGLHAGLR